MKGMQILFVVLLYVTVIGGLNWGFHAAGMNLVEKLANAVGGDQAKSVENGVYYLVALCALAVGGLYAYHLLKKKDEKDH
jgi:uncharacterized membrane protein YuzA (DUF378 family)